MRGLWDRSVRRLSSVFRPLTTAFRRGPEIESAPAAIHYPREVTVYPSGEAPVQGHAAARQSLQRSWVPTFVQDASNDISPGDRLEIVRIARWLEEWSSFANKVATLTDTNVVGTGIMPTPSSSSKQFNKRALDYWNEVAPVLDITETIPFYDAQGIIVRRKLFDGEMFVWLTFADGDKSIPRIQLIETQRVMSSGVRQEKYTEFDGILFNSRGRPEFYVVANDADAFSGRAPTKAALIPRSQMVHFFKPHRAGQPRGVSLFAPIMHDIHDLDDLQQFEMAASKDATSRVRTVYNENGEAPSGDGTVIARSKKIPRDDGTTVDRDLYYKREFGGKTVYMKRGDKSTLDEPMRPTAAQTEFWDRLERKGANGIGLSLAAIMDYAGQWGGAAARGAVAGDNRFYDQQTWSLIPGFQRIYEHVIETGIRIGRLGRVPADWRKCEWQPPRKSTVDIGRDGKQQLEEVRAGWRTERDVIGELGYNYEEVRQQRRKEVRQHLDDARPIAKEFQIPLMTAYSLLSSTPAGIYAAALSDQEPNDPKPGPSNAAPSAPAAADANAQPAAA